MLQTAQTMIKNAGEKLGLSDAEIAELVKTDAEHKFDLTLESGKSYKAYRVQHSNKLGPYKGGIRFHPEVDLEEVRALATLMSLKTAAVGLPLGGGKGGVSIDPKTLSQPELEELSRGYARHLEPHIGPDKDVPAPDVNTNSTIIDWMVDEYERLTGDTSKASFTGKSIGAGGSLGRDAATGRGGVIALRELFKNSNLPPQEITYAVEGFGNVGSFFATIAEREQPGWRLVAASDSSGGITDVNGLSAAQLDKFKQDGGRFTDYKRPGATNLPGQEIIYSDVDVLVLAALGDSVTKDNMKKIKAKYIVELANGPVDEQAYSYLSAKGVVILPDIIANAGGVIVSYLEWLQNKNDEHWSEKKVNEQLETYMVKAVDKVCQQAKNRNATLKEAAFMIAIKRLIS